ncbi:hypothetical protein [Planctellipticum variicoloris]|uniref:hypothetical protein n=1 Tax=Planctellipticum variicoloris TaxID=3064265 RepID=UPI003013B7A5|nr:hypothetical protein SH412_005331 [Planctomycetaceae bacterium SH412]
MRYEFVASFTAAVVHARRIDDGLAVLVQKPEAIQATATQIPDRTRERNGQHQRTPNVERTGEELSRQKPVSITKQRGMTRRDREELQSRLRNEANELVNQIPELRMLSEDPSPLEVVLEPPPRIGESIIAILSRDQRASSFEYPYGSDASEYLVHLATDAGSVVARVVDGRVREVWPENLPRGHEK